MGPGKKPVPPRLRILRATFLRVRTRVYRLSRFITDRSRLLFSQGPRVVEGTAYKTATTQPHDRNTVANTVVGLNHIKAHPSTGNGKPGLLLQIVPYGEFRATV